MTRRSLITVMLAQVRRMIDPRCSAVMSPFASHSRATKSIKGMRASGHRCGCQRTLVHPAMASGWFGRRQLRAARKGSSLRRSSSMLATGPARSARGWDPDVEPIDVLERAELDVTCRRRRRRCHSGMRLASHGVRQLRRRWHHIRGVHGGEAVGGEEQPRVPMRQDVDGGQKATTRTRARPRND